MEKLQITSGSPYEDSVGFCRAIRIGNVVEVAGTATIKDGKTLDGTIYEQTILCLEIIQKALEDAGSSLDHVIRTRMYVTDVTQWEEVGKAHGKFFGKIKPVSTMVEVKGLIDPKMMVEIEALAIVPEAWKVIFNQAPLDKSSNKG